MISQLPMPIGFQQLAIEGYAKHGRGFVLWVQGLHGQGHGQYHPAKECENFHIEPNVEHLKRLVLYYNPVVEFVLFVDFEYQGRRSHLYPRLVPLLAE